MKCDDLIPYLADELKESERMAFAEHLKECAACQKEYDELSQAWHALPFEHIETGVTVPESLKGEVLGFVLDERRDHATSGTDSLWYKIRRSAAALTSQFTPLTTTLTTVLLLAVVSLGITNIQEKNRHAVQQPNEIVTAIPLKAANPSHSGTSGVAYIVQKGSEKNLVVQVEKLPGVEGSQVYQLWLLNDGKRENGGLFKPDPDGSGVLTYHLAEGQTFDQLGITVEPDTTSSQPRGAKIVGS